MVLNEPVTNSLKHTFPQDQGGKIRITLHQEDDEKIVCMNYYVNGKRIPDGFDCRERKTLGMQTICAIVEHQLQGTIAFEAGKGFICRIGFANGKYKERV